VFGRFLTSSIARIADLPFAEDTAQRLMAMARD